MHFSPLDWMIVIAVIGLSLGAAFYIRHFARSVADFLSGNRCAGRYLLTASEGISSMGLVGTVANFEKFYRAGFAASWWGAMIAPISLVIALSGWVAYRFRETRALTMAQFFEMRYSRKFRIFSGILAWFSGVLNYGIFPGIVARFILYFCGLPTTVALGGWQVPTFPLVMGLMLGVATLLATFGGMITVMVSDFLQAQFVFVVYLVILTFLIGRFHWHGIFNAIQATPPGHSLVNPFDQGQVQDFNFWFFAVFVFKAFYNCLGWQGTQGYNSAAKSPHEARMARVLAEWRNGVIYLVMMLLPICAYVLLHDGRWQAEANAARAILSGVTDPQIRSQVTVPVALAQILPAGMLGLFAAAMMAAAIGNDTTYLHSWGSIFIQDVVLPFRKKPFSTTQHIRLLRWSIVGVALFGFCFSLWFSLRDYIFMYMLVTGSIYLAGSGAVIIGGLYWRRGTTAGAWAGMITGAVLAAGAGLLRTAWPSIPAFVRLSPEFPINGAWASLGAAIAALVAYVAVSMLTCRRLFPLDEMLHREKSVPARRVEPLMSGLARRLGLSAEFTRGDRRIYFLSMGWTGFWFLAFIVGTSAGLVWTVSTRIWVGWWQFNVGLSVTVAVAIIAWFLWGGIRDLRSLLKLLTQERVQTGDDGTVTGVSGAPEGRAAVPPVAPRTPK